MTPCSGPSTAATKALVSKIRDRTAQARKPYNIDILVTGVTGVTAINIDVSSKLSLALPVMLVLIVGLALVLLMLVFRRCLCQ